MTITSAVYRRLCTVGLLLATLSFPAPAQTPVREQLLNGLTVLYWQRAADPNVFLKLRLNSGAAFDLAGKAGTMALLGDALFPDPATREYVVNELGGQLEVQTSYDSIQVTISGRAGDLERIVEILRNAIINLNLSAENVTRLRDARLAQLSKAPASPAEIADRAVADRLFGSFPYGRPSEGNLEGVAKVQRADLMLAQERFLHSDNAALVVIGGVDQRRLMRTLRQLLGPWQKGDRSVAATFRQPNAADDRLLLLNLANTSSAEVRLAWRGVSRSDRDAIPASLLARIVRERWQTAVPELSRVSVRNEAHLLPGMFVLAATAAPASVAKALSTAEDVLKAVAQNGPSAAELDNARAGVLADMNRRSPTDLLADAWLDSEILKTPGNVNAEFARASAADVQRVASRLLKDAVQVKVVVADAAQLTSGLGAKIEVRNYQPEVRSASDPPKLPTKP